MPYVSCFESGHLFRTFCNSRAVFFFCSLCGAGTCKFFYRVGNPTFFFVLFLIYRMWIRVSPTLSPSTTLPKPFAFVQIDRVTPYVSCVPLPTPKGGTAVLCRSSALYTPFRSHRVLLPILKNRNEEFHLNDIFYFFAIAVVQTYLDTAGHNLVQIANRKELPAATLALLDAGMCIESNLRVRFTDGSCLL